MLKYLSREYFAMLYMNFCEFKFIYLHTFQFIENIYIFKFIQNNIRTVVFIHLYSYITYTLNKLNNFLII